MELEKIGRRIFDLKNLGAGDQQCEDCLRSQYPNIGSISECKKCIAETPAFSELVCEFLEAKNRP